MIISGNSLWIMGKPKDIMEALNKLGADHLSVLDVIKAHLH